MSKKREELQMALCHYTIDTFTYIHTVREFCEKFSEWKLIREEEMTNMVDIKNRIDSLDLKISDVCNSEEKCKALKIFLTSKLTPDRKRADLEKELVEVLKHTLEGLEDLSCFLEAVEKLAVTSLHVFVEDQVLHLPKGISPEYVQAVITAARIICPLLLEFKRDANVFFLPKLQNVEVLVYQLEKYIQTSEKICEKLEESSFSEVCLKPSETVADVNVELSEDDTQSMLHNIQLLDEIRMDPNFRMVFLFKEQSCQNFISEFDERQPRMLEFLKDLEQCAVQLDKMSKGAKISNVASSSAGAIGGVLSIVGLALIPVTAGLSLTLTMAGVGLGVTSGVNSAVTTAAEIKVNHKHQTKAGQVFQNFMKDVQSLQDCLQDVANQPVSGVEASKVEVAVGVGKIATKVYIVGKGSFDLCTDATSAAKLLQNEEVVTSAGTLVAQEGKSLSNAPKVAADIPDIGQATAKGSLALSQSARASFIALSALFLGMDIFFICKNSISVAKGCETKVSQLIRARVALWSSEISSWQKIRDSLNEGLSTSEKKRGFLDSSFYPGKNI